MGGYGSGGHNKTHKRLESFRRIDSFAFYDYLMADKYLDCKTTVQYPLTRGDIIYHVQSRTALIKVLSIQDGEYRYVDLPLSRVPGIDGKLVRMYFHCPYCGRRVRYLYDYYKHYACRKCAPAALYLIYGVGQQGKGLLSAGHGNLQIINQGSFQKPGIVYLLFFCNPFQPCRESDVCFDALIILFHAE